MRRIVATTVVAAIAASAATAAWAQTEVEERLYRAAVSAAEARLRLHETAAAQHWLDQAPAVHRGWEWRYLKAKADESLRSFAAHDGGVSAVDVAPDGALLVTASADASVTVWEAATGRMVRALAGHTAGVWVARFAPDGKSIATASSDGTVRVWDVATGSERSRLDGVSQGLAGVAWHPSGRELAATGWQRSRERGVWGVVTVWRPESGDRRTLEHGIKPIVTASYSPDGTFFAAGTWDFDVALWSTAAWAAAGTLVPPQSETYKAVQWLAWSPDGARIAVGAKDGTVRLWDAAARSLLHTLSGQAEGRAQPVNGGCFTRDGSRVIAGQGDGTVRSWALPGGGAGAVRHGHAGPVNAVTTSPDGAHVYTGGADGSVRVWDAGGGASAPAWRTKEVVYDAAFAPGGGRVATTGWTGLIEIRDTRTGALERSWTGHEQSGVCVAWSPGGEWLVTTGNDDRVVAWSAATGELRAVLHAGEAPQLTGLAMHPSAAVVAAQTVAGTVKVWELPSGAVLATLTDAVRDLADLAFDPSGRTLAVGARDGTVALWDWAAGTLTRRLDHGKGTTHPAWSPDGRTLAIGGGDRTISLWDAASGSRSGTLRGHDGGVNAVRFSPDGRRIASASGDQSVCVWDAAGGDALLCAPFASTVYNLDWSPDGERLLSLPLERELVWLDSASAADRAPRAVPAAVPRQE